MKWLDPLAPDHLILPHRAALDGVADNRRAFGRFQLEPVLAVQPSRPDHAERARGTGAVDLFPDHDPGVVQTMSPPLGGRSDLRRPDAAEVGDKGSDPLWRRRDHPLVVVPDLHRPRTSPRAPRPACRRHDPPPGRGRDPAGPRPKRAAATRDRRRPRRRLMASAASRPDTPMCASFGLTALSSLKTQSRAIS